MNALYLFDLGSTKSSLAFANSSFDNDIEFKTFEGFNPNRNEGRFFEHIKGTLMIDDNDLVIVYGSGLSSEENQLLVKNKFKTITLAKIQVYDDITGAAHALFGNSEGLLAIMGTGGCTAFYNGNSIERRSGGYGYLIDDLGGGIELGKLIVSKWLNKELPIELDNDLTTYWKCEKDDFTKNFYQKSDLQKLAGISEILAEYIQIDAIQHVLVDYFHLFFNRHVLGLAKEFSIKKMSVVGSIGDTYKNLIKEVAQTYGIEIVMFLKHPIASLFTYQTLKMKNDRNLI